MCWYFISLSLASKGHTLPISGVGVHFAVNNAFNSCELLLGFRAGWFPDNGNKGMDLWDPEHQFLVPGVSRCVRITCTPQYSLICPWNCLEQTLKWELMPQSSRSKWEQRINIHKVLGEDGEPSVSLDVTSLLCCWHSPGTWSSLHSPNKSNSKLK